MQLPATGRRRERRLDWETRRFRWRSNGNANLTVVLLRLGPRSWPAFAYGHAAIKVDRGCAVFGTVHRAETYFLFGSEHFPSRVIAETAEGRIA